MRSRIFTIGTSTRTREEFLAVLAAFGIQAVADIRRFPVSRRHPHFSREALATALLTAGIRYDWLGNTLGGYRTGGYASHMATDAYRAGVAQLEAIARERPTAFLCAERLPSACHRRFVAGTLEAGGWEVIHLLDVGHVWTPGSSGLSPERPPPGG